MISVVVYGRNDNYGYNLHKRAGLSLNCIAHILSDPDDEILFVDYNTPDDFPTFPEAIRDTLTTEAHRRLRIFRVRPEVHRRYQARTHLPVLEAIARNVAVRRSNPSNRWVLSTNTDMIFVCRGESSLSSIVQDLPRGYYHLPRFDIPESIWESFTRLDPANTLAAADYWGRRGHLNEIVRSQPYFLYDAPGDFQLIERDDLLRLRGFSEDMLLGWHIDANMSKRLHLLHGTVGDLSSTLVGYHCNHMRQATPKHGDTRTDNWDETVERVVLPELTQQAESWGCAHEKVEELSLLECPSNVYRLSLRPTIGAPMAKPTTVKYRGESFGCITYDARHVLPYLSDIFVNCARNLNVGWLGGGGDMLNLFNQMWNSLGFDRKILVHADTAQTASPTLEATPLAVILQEADAFIIDFGGITGRGKIQLQSLEHQNTAADLLDAFWAMMDSERSRSGRRRIITINSMNGPFERLVSENIAAVRTRITSRIRQGFVIDRSMPQEWLPKMLVGSSGVLTDEGIRTRLAAPGHVIYGPYNALRPGSYSVTASIRVDAMAKDAEPQSVPLVLEVVDGERFLATVDITWEGLGRGTHTLAFEVPRLHAIATEVRLWSMGALDAAITSIVVEKVG